jgi:hypothetical protein
VLQGLDVADSIGLLVYSSTHSHNQLFECISDQIAALQTLAQHGIHSRNITVLMVESHEQGTKQQALLAKDRIFGVSSICAEGWKAISNRPVSHWKNTYGTQVYFEDLLIASKYACTDMWRQHASDCTHSAGTCWRQLSMPNAPVSLTTSHGLHCVRSDAIVRGIACASAGRNEDAPGTAHDRSTVSIR